MLASPQESRERVKIDRLDEVMIEARFAGPTAVVLLAVTRDGDDDTVLAGIVFPENRRNLVSVHAG